MAKCICHTYHMYLETEKIGIKYHLNKTHKKRYLKSIVYFVASITNKKFSIVNKSIKNRLSEIVYK